MQWPELIRTFRLGAVLAALMVLLAACSGTSVISDSSPGAGDPKGKTVPPIAFQQITGLPPGKLTEMKTALSVAGGQRDIGFVEGSFQNGTFGITGQFKVFASSSGVNIIYQWQVRDTDGVLVQTIDGDDNAGVFTGTDPWSAISSAVIERIARRTTETLAAKLSQLGYATRMSALTVPPSEYFAKAGPDANREIDFETINGPGMAGLGNDMIAAADQPLPPDDPAELRQTMAPVPGETELAYAQLAEDAAASVPSGEKSGAPPPAASQGSRQAAAKAAVQPSPAKAEVRAVAIVPVKGSPASSGDAELAAALRKTLIDAGWPVVDKPQPDALTIVGRVNVAEKAGASQSVSVRWVVRSPDGKTLGDVKQANDVPRGTLDSGWGPVAFAVAESAATGIFDIVRRLQ